MIPKNRNPRPAQDAVARLRILRGIDKLIEQGHSRAAACRQLGISIPTEWRWRSNFRNGRGLANRYVIRYATGRKSDLDFLSVNDLLLLARLSGDASWSSVVELFSASERPTDASKLRVKKMQRPTGKLSAAIAVFRAGMLALDPECDL